ncbi:CocE/NonD family hydrolase [Nonomuraea sp. NPDC049129]|uniref:CocE/NonD family hydrolase n=1 Tax=Nonomuraea sp. NPDC049129 TaxID=3155272 RepID=UPI003411C64F
MSVLGRLFDRFLGLPEAVVDDVAVTRDLRVSMPDGVVLLADRYRPRGAGPLPVVLMRTPYGKHRIDAKAFASVLVRRGMQVVVQNTRGCLRLRWPLPRLSPGEGRRPGHGGLVACAAVV